MSINLLPYEKFMNKIQFQLSKIAFLFIVFGIIAGGAVTQVLSCQMQGWLSRSIVAKHIIGIILVFLFIMLEGGWDFDSKELDKKPNSWASGNVIHTMIYSIIIYLIFILTSKSQLESNLILYGLLFILYLINTQRNYLLVRDRIDEKQNKMLLRLEGILLILTVFVFIYGFIDYILYKKSNLKQYFNWSRFFAGTTLCSFDGKKDFEIKKISKIYKT